MAKMGLKTASTYRFGLVPLIALVCLAEARDIVFPARAPYDGQHGREQVDHPEIAQQYGQDSRQHHHKQYVYGKDDPLRWSETIYAGLSTYGNLPWTYCLKGIESKSPSPPAHAEGSAQASIPAPYDERQHKGDYDLPAVQPYDIAILGAPFDTATTGRPGTRFGPSGIRRGSQRIAPHAAWSAYTHKNPLRSWAKIVDCGDAPLTFLDNTMALSQLQQAHEIIASRPAAASTRKPKQSASTFTDQQSNSEETKVSHQLEDGGDKNTTSIPRIIVLGGDHTTTLAALRAAYKQWGSLSVIHFDSHIDTWDPAVLGGGISHYAGVNHGTFLHIAHEEGLLHNDTNLHVGIRAPVANPRHDWNNDIRCGFEIITARDLDRLSIHGVIDRIKARVQDTKVYISVDIDVLDPAYAPGTGTAEVGGWSTRELLSILDGLEGLNVVGADVVEVSPPYDNAGETTVLAAADVVLSLITLMVEQPVQ